MSGFYSSSQRQQSNVCRYRYPSYLMKVSPPQVCSNFDSNNMLLLPKICNKYSVKKNINSVHYVDDLSVKSNVELNDTTSMKLTGNEFKMTNKATDDYNGFDSCSHHSFGSFKQTTLRNFRYPSYLMKVSPPQVCSNFDSNNMLLLPKICNKYCVRKNSNSVHYIDDMSVKSTVELNDTISTKPTSNKIKMTNKATDNNTGFDSGKLSSFESFQQPTSNNFRYTSYLTKVSPPQVCLNIDNMLIQSNNKMHGVKKNCSLMMNNSQHHLDGVCIKPSSGDFKLTNLNDDKIKTTKIPIDNNQENNCLTLTTNDLEKDSDMKIKNGINCIFNNSDSQQQFITKEEVIDDVKFFKICQKCHKSWNVDNFDWKKVSKTNKIKLLEIIKQNSKTEEPIPYLENRPIITFNNNSNQNLSINKTKYLDKTQNNISI